MKGILELITTVFAFCIAGYLMWLFVQTLKYKEYYVSEQNHVILLTEMKASFIGPILS